MKKLLISAIACCQFLSGCITFYNVPQPGKNEVSVPVEKAIVDFAYKGDDYSAQVKEAASKTSYFTLSENHINAQYIIFISSTSKYISGNNFFPVVLSACTAYLLPFRDTAGEVSFNAFIANTKTGEKADLGAITVTRKTYAGIGVLLFGAMFSSGEYMKDGYSNDVSKYIPVFKEYLVRAAAQVYDAKSKLHTAGEYMSDESRAADIVTKQEITAEDLLFAASNGKDINAFNKAKNKVKGPVDQCVLDLALIANKNGMLSKEMQEYWEIIDSYKKSCVAYRASLKGQIGMTKEQLVDTEGAPNASYKVNDKTEVLTYRKNKFYDGKVFSWDITYTIDGDIVTKTMMK